MLIAAIHSVAAIAFVFSGLPWPGRLSALVLVGTSLCAALRAEQRKSVGSIRLDASGAFAVGRRDDLRAAVLERGCTDFGWAVWLQWREDDEGRRGRHGAMMLVPENLPPAHWRSLRIWLKHKAAGPGRRPAPDALG